MKRKTRTITGIVLTVLLLAAGGLGMLLAAPAPLRVGSQGERVRQAQQRLKDWGYYQDAVDGIFGQQTAEAVRQFQRKNALSVDGVIGQQTADALGISLSDTTDNSAGSAGSYDKDVYLLAKAVYAEARGEPYEGKVAVAAVILNRVKHPEFPNTIAAVIYEPGAFTAVTDGQINLSPDAEAMRAARDALNGWDPSGGCIFYYNPAKSTNAWIFSRPVVRVIGLHRFCM
nr:spore cortex-lytic enzyme [Maliibacterium massiliense]